MIHTFLDPSVESQFRIISKSYNFLFGTTTTQSFTFSTSHFFSGQSRHASSSSIVLYLWLEARRPTASTIHHQHNNPQTSPPWRSRLPLLWCGINGSTQSDAGNLFGRGWPRALRLGLVLICKITM
jgi:hypothetical protein